MLKVDIHEFYDTVGDIHIRNTTYHDVEQCIVLMLTEFNRRKLQKHVLRIASGDCIVIEHNSIILAIIMFSQISSQYRGSEIDYAIVHPRYRHMGLMTHLFKLMAAEVGNKDIYALCWRTGGEVHLKSALSACGFEMLERNALVRNPMYDLCDTCPYYKSTCSCALDLYRRKGSKEIELCLE